MVPAIVIVPVLALLISLGQSKEYAASAQVLLSTTNLGTTLNGLGNPNFAPTPDEIVTTQAALAREPVVAERALLLSHVHATASDLLNRSSVSTSPNADLLDFSVSEPTRDEAARLTTNYAKAYATYQEQLDNQAIDSALAGVTSRLNELSQTGDTGPIYEALQHEQEVLTAAQAAATSEAVVVQPAQGASQVAPQIGRNVAIGLGLGITLAFALAFLMETLDPRIDSVDEVQHVLDVPLLARVPAPPAVRGQPRDWRSLATLRTPRGPEAGAFRALRASLAFAGLEYPFRSLLLATGRDYEGKSTTAANLAVTFVRSGLRVLLCDLDARRSGVGELFGLEGRAGVSDVVLGDTALQAAIVPISASALKAIPNPRHAEARHKVLPVSRSHAVEHGRTQGFLQVLPFGSITAPPDFVSSDAVAGVVEELKHVDVDVLLIDAPPVLPHRDGLALSAMTDAVVVVVAAPLKRTLLEELSQTMSTSRIRPIGFVALGAFLDGRHTPSFSHHLEQSLPSGNGHAGWTFERPPSLPSVREVRE